MSIDMQKFTTTDVISIPFGMRLKSAREARGLESKDVAAQLRLSEKMIAMIEKETYPSDLPITFVRGYIRAYARLMEIPDTEITKALEPIKPLTTFEDEEHELIESQPVTSGNYFMQFFTYLILLTILSLVGVWWYSQSSPENRAAMMTEVPNSNATDNATNSNIPLPNPEVKEKTAAAKIDSAIDSNANKLAASNITEETNLLPSDSLMAAELITGQYAIQSFVHFLLFLLIGFMFLWWYRQTLNKPSALLTSLILFSLMSLGSIWWYYYSQFVLPSIPWKIKEEPIMSNNMNNQEIEPKVDRTPLVSVPEEDKLHDNTPPVAGKNVTNHKTDNEKTQEIPQTTIKSNPQGAEKKAKSQTKPNSSGQYTPVSREKKITSTSIKNPILAEVPAPVDNEFAELDENDTY